MKALIEEQTSGSLRGMADLDARLMALQAKVNSQEEEIQLKMSAVVNDAMKEKVSALKGQKSIKTTLGHFERSMM